MYWRVQQISLRQHGKTLTASQVASCFADRPPPVRLLVSARDPAAAAQLAAVCRVLRADARFELGLVAQAPAADMLRKAGLSVVELPIAPARQVHDAQAEAALAAASDILKSFAPDVVLCGLSSPAEGGIDEALQARSTVPVAVLQDFWGELNPFFGARPALAMVLDEYAAALTRGRHSVPVTVVGSPRHGEYRSLPIMQMRTAVRSRFNSQGRAVIGLFGQPLGHLRGYYKTLEAWSRAVRQLGTPACVVYRPHPRETNEHIKATQTWLGDQCIEYVTAREWSTEEALVACDAACTIFSNCAYDAAYLNYFCDTPLLTPVLMLFDEQLRSVLGATGDYERLPYFTDSLAMTVGDERTLADHILQACAQTGRQAAWQAAKRRLGDPSLAIERVAHALLALTASRRCA